MQCTEPPTGMVSSLGGREGQVSEFPRKGMVCAVEAFRPHWGPERRHHEQRQIHQEVKASRTIHPWYRPFQSPKDPSHVFIGSFVFLKFAKVKYLNCNPLRLLALFTLTSLISHFTHVGWPWSGGHKHFGY